MVVQHNISAMTANRYYTNNNSALGKSMEKLSSGLAINRAGDNAAGLAVSEKMRAQISGLTQASKNAQDGISMVQTFEGALQETDSILQRMRTLAVQSANGSYADDVDRDAIQLEFDQLNDELNQIADTDYNGVVALNGGVMADGTVKDANNKIDYSTKRSNVRDELVNLLNKEAYGADGNGGAKAAAAAAKTAAAAVPFDVGETTDLWNTVDNSKYTTTVANNLWKDLGLTKNGQTSGEVDLSKGNEVSVTFAKQADGSWKATSGTINNNDGSTSEKLGDLSATQLGKITATKVDGDSTTTGKGGFTVTSTSNTTAGSLGNAIFDATDIPEGSTVTLTYSNAANSQYAPANMGFKIDTVDVDSTGSSAISTPTIAKGDVVDSEMNDTLEALFSSLNDKEVVGTYTANSLTVTVGGESVTTSGGFVTLDTDKKFHMTLNDTNGTITIKDVKKDASNNDQAGDNVLATITLSGKDGNRVGTAKGTIEIEAFNYEDNSDNVKITLGDGALGSKGAEQDAANSAASAAKDTLDGLETEIARYSSEDFDLENADNWKEVRDRLTELRTSDGRTNVSVSDSFDHSKAKLTFTDNMSLQVGARTKDMVKFNFTYNSDDLGGLEKNMNCSAREGGLETAKLSLKTQESANDAIDKIDKALNKVSMVRATFGGIQNRLEHKINNLDTNTENLTAAESRIRDTQMDQEMMKFTSAQILAQASQSMLAQANSLPQGVLQLLG